MRYILIIILFSLASCSQKLTTSTGSNDSIREVKIYVEKLRFDTVAIRIPYEVIRDFNSDTARAETSVAIAKSWVNSGSVFLDLRNKQLSLKHEVMLVDRYITNDVRRSRDDNTTNVVEIAKMNGWQRWHYYVGLLSELMLICLLCVWIGRKISKIRK